MAYDLSWPEHSTPTGTEVHYNNIVDNKDYGVKSVVWGSDTGGVLAEEVDATNNWWGHSSGPGTVGSGSGDTVSTNVDYEPWLLEIDGPSFDKTLTLQDGWTLISPDKRTDGSEVWIGGTLALKYTPTGGFVEATSADLGPLTAIYIKTDGSGGIGFNYAEEEPTMLSKELEAGWNLLSIPDMAADTCDILSPLRYITIGTQQGIGLATLVSQGDYNQFASNFYEATLTDDDWTNLPILYPFDGYWAYMNAAKTFEVIPVR